MKMSITFLGLGLLSLAFMIGCTKSDLPEPSGVSIANARLYDDSLADPRNHSNRIAAGNGRLLMTYGRTFEGGIYYNNAMIAPLPPDNVWMLTDNDGNLLRKDTLPKGLSIGGLLPLQDNRFLILTFIDDPQWQMSYEGMQIMILDANGVMGAVDSIYPPTSQPISDVFSVHVFPANNGNAIVSFGYQGAAGFGGSFIGEMNMQGDFLWHKEWTDLRISGCEITDGGYLLMAGLFNLATYSATMQIIKMNPVGDSLWTQSFDCVNATEGPLVATGNGHYRFAFSDYTPDYSRYYSIMYEINSEGVFQDSVSFDYIVSALMHKNDGNSFVLSSMERLYGNVSEQFNSQYVLLDAGLQITSAGTLQNQSSDMLNAGCKTSDGKIACFGVTQSYDQRYYKPELIIVN